MSYRLAFLLTLSVGVLSGCATTGLSKQQCQQLTQNSTDWQKVGLQDGLMGRDASYFNQHLQSCSALVQANATPTQIFSSYQKLWEQGRQQGIKQYCTPLRAYQLGREGIAYNNICPPEQTVELLKAHDEGYYNYQREQLLYDMDDDFFPFGWGYGSRYGYGGFGGFGSWRYRDVHPHTVPRYVPNTTPTAPQAAPK